MTERDQGTVIEKGGVRRLESTLERLEVAEHKDRFNLAGSGFTLVSIKQPEAGETHYLGLLHHPLSGNYLSQVLSEVAPFPSGVADIVDDFNEAKRSHKKWTYGDRKGSYLDRVHAKDPDVGQAYSEFFDSHMERWKRALKNTQYDKLFATLRRLKFTLSIDALAAQITAQWVQDQSTGDSHFSFNAMYDFEDSVLESRSGDFATFLRQEQDFLKGLNTSKELDDNGVLKRYERLSGYYKTKQPMIFKYLKQLPQDQLKELGMHHLQLYGNIYVDMVQKQVIQPSDSVVDIEFTEAGFWLKEKNAGAVQVGAWLDEEVDKFNWAVAKYRLNSPHEQYLLPLWAWSLDREGQRRFLRQDEAQRALIQAGLAGHRYQADVMLGRVCALMFNPQAAYDWDDKISLQANKKGDRTRPQAIAGAQVGAWISMPNHAKDVLEDIVIDKLEHALD